MEFKRLVTIDNVNVYTAMDGSYLFFFSDLDICNDGVGPSHGDPYYQAQTAYLNNGQNGGGKYLNADTDKYIVTPPQIRSGVKPVVMGCQGRVTNIKTRAWHWGMVGDIGPSNKTGECANCLAKILNPATSYNVGDQNRIYLYEFWPGVPAVVDDRSYKLQPASSSASKKK